MSSPRASKALPWFRAGPGVALRALLVVVVALLSALPAIACRDDDEAIRDVRLTSGPFTTLSEVPEGEAPLHFVLTSVLSPDRSTLPFARLSAHLTARLGRRVVMVRRRTYRELSDLLRNGHADAGIICAGAYAFGREEFGLRMLAVPVMGGSATYRAYVIARRGNGQSRLDDFKGRVFAFSDPLSNSGYRHVAATLFARHTTPDHFFARTLFTYSHDNTISAVRDGIADGGVVDSLVWEHLLREEPRLADQVEVIERSGEFPNSPVVASPRVAPELAARLRGVLLDMSEDSVGKEILLDLGISAFINVPESMFDPIAESWRDLGVLTTPSREPQR
jgi:phosphonate transport system substrate-binding protein